MVHRSCRGIQCLKKLSQLRDFAARAIEEDTIAFIATYSDGKIMTCNNAFLKITGYTREEVAGMKWPDDFTPGEQKRNMKAIIESLKCDSAPHRYEKMNLGKNNRETPVEIFIHMFCDDNDEPKFYYSFINDISDRKITEHKLLQANSMLEEKVKKRSEDIQNTNSSLLKEIEERKAIEKKLRDAISQSELYVDVMSHDISNMNQSILGYLEILQSTCDLQEEHKEFIDKPIEMINNMSRLINSVKKLQQVAYGRIELKMIDISQMLDKVISKYESVNGRDVTINFHPGSNCTSMVNRQLEDVFTIIIENAIKHSKEKLVINVKVGNVSDNGHSYCKVEIEDNGPGITDELKDKILKDMNEITNTTIRRGLGLYYAKTLINIFKGSISVEDRVRGDHTKGSKFIVVLPTVH